jgi:hypothetical protein
VYDSNVYIEPEPHVEYQTQCLIHNILRHTNLTVPEALEDDTNIFPGRASKSPSRKHQCCSLTMSSDHVRIFLTFILGFPTSASQQSHFFACSSKNSMIGALGVVFVVLESDSVVIIFTHRLLQGMELGFWTVIVFNKNTLPFPQVITTLNWLTHYHVQCISWLWMQRLTIWKSVLSIVVSFDNYRQIPCLKSSF